MTSEKKISIAPFGWDMDCTDFEYNRSGPIIINTLNWLREKRIFVTLMHNGYQSCATVVIEVGHDKIVIDKPRDWMASRSKIKVIFRNQLKLWSFFSCELLATSSDSLYFKIPNELFFIQRRQNYRITLPEGSMATFLYNTKKCKLNIQDLSTGGMLLSGTSPRQLPPLKKTIEHIIISIPSTYIGASTKKGIVLFKITDGEIVRSFANKNVNLYFAGVKFSPSSQEEGRIMKYIREQELIQLRKGILYL